MSWLARILFENSPWDPATTAFLAGFAVLGWDGQIYLTDAGEAYLESIA